MGQPEERKATLTTMLHNPHPDPRLPFLLQIQQQPVLPSNTLARPLLPKHLSTNHLRLVERNVHIALRMDDLQNAHLSRCTFAVIGRISMLQQVRRSRCRTRVSREPFRGWPLVDHAIREGFPEPWKRTQRSKKRHQAA